MARRKYRAIPRVLSPEDKLFIKLVQRGINRSKAYRMANPEHPTVKKYMDAVKTKAPAEEKRAASQAVTQLSKDKIQSQHIQSAMVTFMASMDKLADKSLDVADDLLDNGSDKVKADLAKEFIRHKIGTPVQSVKVSQQQDIVITFGDAHPDDAIDYDDIQEAEIIENEREEELRGDDN